MKTEDEIRERIARFGQDIDKELDRLADDPIQQWMRLKSLHAMQVALEWVIS
jgi:hypothetical protein